MIYNDKKYKVENIDVQINYNSNCKYCPLIIRLEITVVNEDNEHLYFNYEFKHKEWINIPFDICLSNWNILNKALSKDYNTINLYGRDFKLLSISYPVFE